MAKMMQYYLTKSINVLSIIRNITIKADYMLVVNQ